MSVWTVDACVVVCVCATVCELLLNGTCAHLCIVDTDALMYVSLSVCYVQVRPHRQRSDGKTRRVVASYSAVPPAPGLNCSILLCGGGYSAVDSHHMKIAQPLTSSSSGLTQFFPAGKI